jgi:hypothetical protein
MQGVIDVFNLWQLGRKFDWQALSIHSSLKKDYNDACLKYFGLGTQILDKEIYQLDVSLILEELDFYYLAGVEFFGDRGYFGYDLHSFTDCLIELHKYNGYTPGKTILFRGGDKINDPQIESFLNEIKSVLLRFGFKPNW